METPVTIQKVRSLTVSAAFLVLLLLPLVDMQFKVDKSEALDEKRVLAEVPKTPQSRAEILGFPSKFETYFNDHFGFRKSLVRWNSIFHVRYLASSPPTQTGTNEKSVLGKGFAHPLVLVGRDGFLFTSNDFAIDLSRGKEPFTDENLKFWGRVIMERQLWLAPRNGRYYYAIAPNKKTIYPEKLPSTIRIYENKTRLQQLEDFASKLTVLNFIPLREPLLLSKERFPGKLLYLKADTHWNKLGAFVAAEQILTRMKVDFPTIKIPSIDDYNILEETTVRSDMALALGLGKFMPEPLYDLVPKAGAKARPVQVPYRHEGQPSFRQPIAFETGDESLPTAVIYHDSFAIALFPILAEHFERVVFTWSGEFRRPIMEAEKPDIVLTIQVERLGTRHVINNYGDIRSEAEAIMRSMD